MAFPEGISHTLKASSLAVPPLDSRAPQRINLNDMHLELSEEMEPSEPPALEERPRLPESGKDAAAEEDFVFLRECFKYEDSVGYLLSNGVVGILDKKDGTGCVFEFGEQFYYRVERGGKPMKKQVPEDHESDGLLVRLFHFKAFFVQKYSLFKLEEMRKRTVDRETVVWMVRGMPLGEVEMVTRLSNSIIQMHFRDLTSMAFVNEEASGLVFFVGKKGHPTLMQYKQCKSSKLKTKWRKFKRILEKLENLKASGGVP